MGDWVKRTDRSQKAEISTRSHKLVAYNRLKSPVIRRNSSYIFSSFSNTYEDDDDYIIYIGATTTIATTTPAMTVTGKPDWLDPVSQTNNKQEAQLLLW